MTNMEGRTATLRRRTVVAMAVSAIGFSGAMTAQAAPNLVDLSVVNRETGQALRVWRHEGRLFVAGDPGARYSLRITNNTDGRVLVVMSVDGVNILSGETAGYGQRGYVFGPYQTYDISGWRKSDTEVAAFTFASLRQSYAARTGRPGDVGVIGVAVFKERVVQAQVSPAKPEARARNDFESDLPDVAAARRGAELSRPAASARSATPPPSEGPRDLSEANVTAQRREEKLGTAHGAREWSVAMTVPFERATRLPQLVRRIEYDTYERLVARGVAPPPWEPGHRPRPFPGNGGGYVPNPPGDD